MVLKDKQVAIVGGGPGGLTLARLLQIKGVDVKVYERDFNRDVRVQGATLDLHQESGLKALQEAGIMDAFKANYRPGADRVRVVDEHAKIHYDEHEEAKTDDFDYPYFRPEIDRGPLRDILLDALQPGTVIWDSQFIIMSQVNKVWKLEFKNGTAAAADIVIGSDGANSKIRPFITPIKSFYSGVTIVEGSIDYPGTAVPEIHQLLKGGKIFGLGNEKTLSVSAKGDGSLQFYTGFKAAEDWVSAGNIDFTDKARVAAWFKQEYKEWDSLWLGLFINASAPFIPRLINCMPLDQTWDAQSNITMLGDAAHLMPPYAGEGVNMAMLDALELSECLTGDRFNDTQTAIAAYERQMRARVSEVAWESLYNTEWMHGKGALDKLLDMFDPARRNLPD